MGGTLAEYADAGVPVTIVTGTRGEVGEIHNRDDADEIRDRLGEVRTAEMLAACEVLGVTDHAFLGYRDSGMMGTDDNANPASFWQADYMEAVGRLVTLIRSRTPEVMTAYDVFGGYGHPDHIQVHRIGTAAYFSAADIGRFPVEDFGEPHQPARLYWAGFSRQRAKARLEAMGVEDFDEPDWGVLDEHITTRRDIRPWVDRKFEALFRHDTQFPADSWLRLSAESDERLAFAEETFILAHSVVDTDPADPDLFHGLS